MRFCLPANPALAFALLARGSAAMRTSCLGGEGAQWVADRCYRAGVSREATGLLALVVPWAWLRRMGLAFLLLGSNHFVFIVQSAEKEISVHMVVLVPVTAFLVGRTAC